MWSQLLFCFLVGLTSASEHSWKADTEYVYKVSGRTLTALHDVSSQYAGILFKAKLIIHPRSDNVLVAKLIESQYAPIHSNLPEGWNTYIPSSKLSLQPLQLTDKPFEIIFKNGVIVDLKVSKDVPEWVANILKSIVSQFQLDMRGDTAIKSNLNQLPEEGSYSGSYKVMEETVTGKYETHYVSNVLPGYMLLSKPWLAPLPHLKGNGEIINIVKTKKFSNSEDRVGYHFGFSGMGDSEPFSNKIGDFFTRTAVSNVVLTGNLHRYVIQSSVTTNKIIVSPALYNNEKGMVVSQLNVTVLSMQPVKQSLEEPSDLQSLGSLVYSYNKPFSSNNQARPKQPGAQSAEENSSGSSSSSSEESAEQGQQEVSRLEDPPKSPLLPFTVGYHGQSIKLSQNVHVNREIEKLSQEISQDTQDPQEIPKKETLSKFVTLSSLVRLLSYKELEELSRNLYKSQGTGVTYSTWTVFRDAVAQSGSGPAFLTIENWIQNKKIQAEEAAQVIATFAATVHQPSYELIRKFYALSTSSAIAADYVLNDVTVLALARLIRRVYASKRDSHNQFPVHIFGSFRYKEGVSFMENEYIPYLTQQLHNAVSAADNHKIHISIRALGLVGHRNILAAFKPYLEGKKEASHFQRLQMVLSLDKLVYVNPSAAQNVLYKIYRNIGDKEEIRTAAVYLLMRTEPPTEMVQFMAQYTNIDVHEQVNAAVKSVLKAYAGFENSDMSSKARSAIHLLTPKEYGLQFSKSFLRHYVIKQSGADLFHLLQWIGSNDKHIPKTLQYSLLANLGGIQRRLLKLRATVSSIDDLLSVFYHQTEQYQQEKEQVQNAHSEQNKFSNKNIERVLNLEVEDRDELEGNIFLGMGGGYRMITFTNKTINKVRQELTSIEDLFRMGCSMSYTKFVNRFEMAMSLPTEMGLPMMFSLDTPTYYQAKGHVKAEAKPRLSSGGKLSLPNSVQMETAMSSVFSGKLQSKLGFITMFDHQQYISGYDKNIQLYFPIKANLEFDIKNRNLKAEIQPIESEKNFRMYHYSTVPYTSKHSIIDFQPVVSRPSSYIINAKEGSEEKVIGKETGMCFRVHHTFGANYFDMANIYNRASYMDIFYALTSRFYTENIQHSRVEMEYAADLSSSRKVDISLWYDKKYEKQSHTDSNDSGNAGFDLKQLSEMAASGSTEESRKQQFSQKVSAGIRSAFVFLYGISVEFPGKMNTKYTTTFAYANSRVDPNSRLLFFHRKFFGNSEGKPYIFAASAKAHIPRPYALDVQSAWKSDQPAAIHAHLAYGENVESATKIKVQAKLSRSESRKQYWLNDYKYQLAKKELEEGNAQLEANSFMTRIANQFDQYSFDIQYENRSPSTPYFAKYMHWIARYLDFTYLPKEAYVGGNNDNNRVSVEAQFNPTFRSVNLTVKESGWETKFENFPINSFIRPIFAAHPVATPKTRFIAYMLGLKSSYAPLCVIDRTGGRTFDNKSYPIRLGSEWSVAFHYVPRIPQHLPEQDKPLQIEAYTILMRESKSGEFQKDVKIIMRNPLTKGQFVEIDIAPSANSESSGTNPRAKVFVNNQQQQYDDQRSTDSADGQIQMYSLPDGELRLVVQNKFFIMYDKVRVKLLLLDDMFKDAVRGLCGTYNNEYYNDFLTPNNRLVSNPSEFLACWTIFEEGSQNPMYQKALHAKKSPYYYPEIKYANVISNYDIGRQSSFHRSSSTSAKYSKQQTYYVEDDGSKSICFSLRALPACKEPYKPTSHVIKTVSVHCVERNNVSELWKKQIEKGASPDFSMKSETKKMKIKVAAGCK